MLYLSRCKYDDNRLIVILVECVSSTMYMHALLVSVYGVKRREKRFSILYVCNYFCRWKFNNNLPIYSYCNRKAALITHIVLWTHSSSKLREISGYQFNIYKQSVQTLTYFATQFIVHERSNWNDKKWFVVLRLRS